MSYQFSLLHATYHRQESPLAVKDAWLSAAAYPDAVEYIFALDEDDLRTVARTSGHARVVSPPTGKVTAVRNWNAAAAASSGEVLVVVADDLFPPRNWDVALAEIIGSRLDPTRVPFAVKVRDTTATQSPVGDTLLRHPIVSRAFYEKFGLFSPKFTGIACDADLTRRALWRSAILDGRSRLALEHRHATTDRPSVSTAKLNDRNEYESAGIAYAAAWSPRQRAARVRLVRTDVVPVTPGLLELARRWNATLARISYATYGLRRTLRP